MSVPRSRYIILYVRIRPRRRVELKRLVYSSIRLEYECTSYITGVRARDVYNSDIVFVLFVRLLIDTSKRLFENAPRRVRAC